ncbi:UNVERIFIED_CONTAM: hypothetical protein Slati_4256200 [Sesamum latifolium]|uniref:Reverse transcriptase n=1 Tax=Sesamum latifolium TaxID=2727402 RepID=A0AAW2TCJ2_9LAMI
MLRQRAKMTWLKEGDICSHVFFTKVAARRASSKIYQINNTAGQLLTTQPDIMAEFVSYYQRLLGGTSQTSSISLEHLQSLVKHSISAHEAVSLETPVLGEEIQLALFNMANDKAPGPDGFPAGFYKAAWSVIGEDITLVVQEFFRTGRMLKQLNATLLTLVPKVQQLLEVSAFRPIACCNAFYIIITTVLVARLKKLGSVPITYLGLPLVSLKLSVADCRSLLPKVDRHISGNSSSGYAKVPWHQVCQPRECGGLSIPNLLALNKALMCKHLWDVLTRNESSIWVNWVRRFRLHKRSIWDQRQCNNTWAWRKLTKLLPLIQPKLQFHIGNGDTIWLWTDPWHSLGPLVLVFPRGPALTGLPFDYKLSSVIAGMSWQWPSTSSPVLQIIQDVLLPILGGQD